MLEISMALRSWDRNKPFDSTQGHEPFDPELMVEGLEAEWLGAAVSPMDKS